jgi:hypothetical protein
METPAVQGDWLYAGRTRARLFPGAISCPLAFAMALQLCTPEQMTYAAAEGLCYSYLIPG